MCNYHPKNVIGTKSILLVVLGVYFTWWVCAQHSFQPSPHHHQRTFHSILFEEERKKERKKCKY